jgi:hypothetical protein
MERISRLAPLSGLIAVTLFAAGNAIWGLEQPERDAGSEEIVSFYENTSSEILIGGTLSVIAVLFFVWFGAVLYEHLADAEGTARTGLPLTAFAGVVLTAAVGLGAETINMAGALSADDGQLTADTAQIYFDVSYTFGAPAAGVAIAIATVPVAVVALRTGRVVQRWAAWLVLLVAVAMLTPLMLTPWFGLLYLIAMVLLAGFSLRIYREDSGGAARRSE